MPIWEIRVKILLRTELADKFMETAESNKNSHPFPIASRKGLIESDYTLVHDSYDGSCWLFPYGKDRQFARN